MKIKWKYILSMCMGFILIIMVFVIVYPEKLFPDLFSTYIETIESNWGIALPAPKGIRTILNDRTASHGDGDAITELQYEMSDIEMIKKLSVSWVSGDDFKLQALPDRVKELILTINRGAAYSIQVKSNDYVIFELHDQTMIIYESYI